MKITRLTLEIMFHCLYQSFRHPLTILRQAGNPVPVEVSPIPWWGSGGLILIGIITWCFAFHWKIEGLDEAARAMVYIPLGNMFGMSLALTGQVIKKKK